MKYIILTILLIVCVLQAQFTPQKYAIIYDRGEVEANDIVGYWEGNDLTQCPLYDNMLYSDFIQLQLDSIFTQPVSGTTARIEFDKQLDGLWHTFIQFHELDGRYSLGYKAPSRARGFEQIPLRKGSNGDIIEVNP